MSRQWRRLQGGRKGKAGVGDVKGHGAPANCDGQGALKGNKNALAEETRQRISTSYAQHLSWKTAPCGQSMLAYSTLSRELATIFGANVQGTFFAANVRIL